MMCKSGKSFQLHSWQDMLINDTEASGNCEGDGEWDERKDSCDPIDLLPNDPFEMSLGSISTSIEELIGYNSDDYEVDVGGYESDEDEVKMNSSCDHIDLLPADPFEMNVEIDKGKRASGIVESWIACSTRECKVRAGDPFLNLFEKWLKTIVEFNKVAFSESFLGVTTNRNFGVLEAKEEASFSDRDLSEPVFDVTESLASFEKMIQDFISGCGFSGLVLDVARDRNFESCEVVEDILKSDERNANHSDGDVNCLHEGLFSSLAYLGVQDLLSVEKVCKPLCSVVRNDHLLWRLLGNGEQKQRENTNSRHQIKNNHKDLRGKLKYGKNHGRERRAASLYGRGERYKKPTNPKPFYNIFKGKNRALK